MKALKAKIVLFLMAAIGRLPLVLARYLGAGIGRLAWVFQPREVKVTQRNIDLCFPHLDQQAREVLARKSVIESGKLSIEINVVWHRSIAWLMKRLTSIEGEELITQPNETQRRGVIVVCPHNGNWEVIGIHSSSLGPMGILYQPPKQAYIEPLMRRSRARMGATQLTTDVRGVAGLLKMLKKGQTVGILPDQVPDDGSGEFADFYAIPAYTMTLVHRLIEKTGCKVVMAAALRHPQGFRVIYKAPPADIYSADQATSLRALNRAVEDIVSMSPEQYQWEYKRFRKRPPGKSSVYIFNK